MKPAIFSLVFEKLSLEDAIRQSALLGYAGIEIMCRSPHLTDDTPLSEIEKLKKILDENRLPVVNLGTYTGHYSKLNDAEAKLQLDKLKYYLTVADILDCPMVRQWSGGPSIYLATPEMMDKSVYWFGQAGELAAKAGKKIVVEIHNGSLIETVESAGVFMNKISHPSVGLIHDAGNMYITGTDYGEKSIDILLDKIFHVHIKDIVRVQSDELPHSFHNQTKNGDEIFQYRLLGEGEVDHRPAIRKLKQSGYQGYLSAECHGMSDAINTARHELTEINRLINLD